MDIRIYKLKYHSIEEGINDLKSKGILQENMNWSFPIHAVVDLNNGEWDIMVKGIEYDFGNNLIEPETPNHSFYGW